MTPERNVLMEQAYPQLKEYCRTKYRFEFQVIYHAFFLHQEGLTCMLIFILYYSWQMILKSVCL